MEDEQNAERTLWEYERRPNYQDNKDKLYPYSEVPYLGQYYLVKIPISLNDLIKHVDYWGEGRTKGPDGTRGFPNCYNVNHTYKLVSYGNNKDRKIPNRIPVKNNTQIDTRAYLKDNSVLRVTVMGEKINNSCAADIARIVNNDNGIVITYDYELSSPDIANLTEHLKSKDIFILRNCVEVFSSHIPEVVKEVASPDKLIIFVNESLIKSELCGSIIKEDYSDAVFLTTSLEQNVRGAILKAVYDQILNGVSIHYNKFMTYAHQLWKNGHKNIVRNHLPASLKSIFGSENVKIINKGYNQAMKLGEWTNNDGNRIAWGDHNLKLKLGWQFKPIYVDNRVIFTIFNVDANMCLMSVAQKDSDGDRMTYGSKSCDTNRHKYIVEPFIKHGVLCYHIINYEYRQGLKLALDVDSYGDRRVVGHNGDIYQDEDRFKWIITKF